MDISTEKAPQTTSAKLAKKDKGATTAPPSNAPSPKPSRAAKEPPPPLPQGSGLISGALFGVDDSSTTSKSAPNIILHVPLHGANNKVVNFARMAEEKYGFAALHPRLAAQRERLARVAAASAALEKSENGTKGVSAGDSAEEDLSVDVDRDSDGDGDVSMSGTGLATGANSAGNDVAPTADGKKKRARKKKIEEYDREDPFVDDSEMAWQEHAAASKDGFFVYSGPLVPDGDKVQVERADGTIKRGRGRGRGAGRARTTHHHVPIVSSIPISPDTGLPVRGPGSRGGAANRKSRSTKTARVQTEQQEHDKLGATPSLDGKGRSGSARGGGNAASNAGNSGGNSAAGSRGKASTNAIPLTSIVGLAPGPAPNLLPAPPSISGPGIMMR
ncbi:hypothetical protein V8E54_009646 [Elaphomyces granulatus]